MRITAAGIWTGDPGAPWRSCIDVEAGRVAPHGSSPGGTPLDFPGGWILPGLIDAHLHLTMGSLSRARLDLAGIDSREAFQRAIALEHQRLGEGQWLEAFGWDDALWGGTPPDGSWLAHAHARPAVAWRCDQHVALCNAAALAHLDLSREVSGGTIVRDAAGAPTGLLVEQAAWQLLVPKIPQPPIPQRRDALARGCEHLLSLGITSVGAMEYLEQVEDVLAPLRDSGALPLRVSVTVLDRSLPLPIERARRIACDDRLRLAGFKSFADGTLGAATAAMLEPYANAPGSGALIEHALEGTLEPWMRAVLDAGLSPSIHAIGDRALEHALACAERCDGQRRTRFEHAQTVDPASLARFALRRVSMQPLHRFGDWPVARGRLGPQRMDRVFRFRDFLASGASLAFGSDWPIVSASPIEGMRCAITGVTRCGTGAGHPQSLTPAQAIHAYTEGAARCLETWPSTGTLTAGAHADCVVLDRDPLHCDWVNAPPRIVCTLVGGQVAADARTAVTA